MLDEIFLKYSFDVMFVRNFIDFKCKENECFKLEKCIFYYILRKIVYFGLIYEYLKLVFERGRLEGIENILGEKNDSG